MVSTSLAGSCDFLSDWDLDDFFRSVVEAAAESIWNALFLAETMEGRDFRIRQALPLDLTLEIIKRWQGGLSLA